MERVFIFLLQYFSESTAASIFAFFFCLALHAFFVLLLVLFARPVNYHKMFILFFCLFLLYVIAVPIPYHFQGYADITLDNSSFIISRKPLGWTGAPIIVIFSYFLSMAFIGLSWIAIPVVFMLGASMKLKRVAYYAIALTCLALCVVFVVYRGEYEIINFVLE